jgi:hypothetical protein
MSLLLRLKSLIDEFESPDQVVQLVADIRMEKVRDKHRARMSALAGDMEISEWGDIDAYMTDGTLEYPDVRSIHADLEAARLARDDDAFFFALLTIAKATKPYELYPRT